MSVDTVEHLISLAVDNGTLLVHYVVVLEDLTAHRVVLALDVALSVLNLTGEHTHGERRVLVDVKHLGDTLHSVAAEQAHEVVLHGEVEHRRADVALTSASAAELIVYAARFVSLGTDNAQAADGDDLFFFLLNLDFVLVVEFLKLLASPQYLGVFGIEVSGSRADLLFAHADVAHALDCKVLCVAAQHNIGWSRW